MLKVFWHIFENFKIFTDFAKNKQTKQQKNKTNKDPINKERKFGSYSFSHT